jgi:hypothetical protein
VPGLGSRLYRPHLAFHGLGLDQQALAGLGQRLALLGLLEQALPERLLEPPQSPPDRGGVHAQAGRGAAELPGARDGEEMAQVVPLHPPALLQPRAACLSLALHRW